MAFREGEFTQIKGGVTIFIDKHEADDSISGIFVSDESKPDIKVTLTAEKGRIIKSENGSRILFINGVRQELNKKTYQFNSLAFSRYSADFNIEQNHGKRNQTARELSLKELLNSRNNPDFSEQQQRKNIVEGHRRLIYPFYNLISALLACVGLLISSFNRRGQTKIIAIEVLCMIVVMGGDLAVTNLAGRSLYFISLLYLNCLVPLCACLYLLLFYNPSFFRHKSVKELLNAA
jgi:lipopolysaccharide export LptBFGC system permease protein LptF